jgi:hypothetical protein
MHRFAPLAIALAGACPATLFARPPLQSEFGAAPWRDVKRELAPSGGPAATVPQPGEDCGSAIGIGALPFAAAGATCEFRDDYTPPCCQLPGAPDAVYAYTPPADVCVEVDLCGSGYDTAVHVFDAGPEQSVACNDDDCGLGSRLSGLQLFAGRTYYFVVDGWSTSCGSFALEVRECPSPCPLPEPTGAREEGEPICTENHFDRYNTGCNDYPYTFTNLPCSDELMTVSGTFGTWRHYDEDFRDTDWYQIELGVTALVELRVQGGAPTQIAILDGRRGCGEWGVACGSVFGAACEWVGCDAELEPGTYWLFVAPSAYRGVACGTRYTLTVQNRSCSSVAARPAAWGAAKQRYR